MSLNKYEPYLSNETKSNIVLDLILHEPLLAQEAFEKYIVNNDPQQISLEIFTKNYQTALHGNFMLDGPKSHFDNELAKQTQYKFFLPTLIKQIIHSFTLLLSANNTWTYEQLTEKFTNLSLDEKNHFNDLIALHIYKIQKEDKIKWLEEVINFRRYDFHFKAIFLTQENMEVLKKYFPLMSETAKVGYILSTNIYSHIKDELRSDFFEILDDIRFFIKNYNEKQITEKLFPLVLSDDNLSLDLLIDYVEKLKHKEKNLKKEIEHSLHLNIRMIGNCLYDISTIKKEKHQWLEKHLNISVMKLFEKCHVEEFFNFFFGIEFELKKQIPHDGIAKLNTVLDYFLENSGNSFRLFNFNVKDPVDIYLTYYCICLVFSFESPAQLSVLSKLIKLSTLNKEKTFFSKITQSNATEDNILLKKLLIYLQTYQNEARDWLGEKFTIKMKQAPMLLEKLILESNNKNTILNDQEVLKKIKL